ncbi:translationally-controlled tumor protein homolog [Neosynchiropus ocellatus]
MIIYKDIISNDEMFSDIYKITESPCGLFLIVEGKTVTRKEGFDDNLICANASADADASEDTPEVMTVTGVDIVLNHKLVEVPFTKDQYKEYLKKYMKDIKGRLAESNPCRVDCFTKTAAQEVKTLLKKFDNFQFYTGEKMDVNGAVGLLDYRECDDVPIMIFFKDGLELEKCPMGWWFRYLPFNRDRFQSRLTWRSICFDNFGCRFLNIPNS